MDMALFAAKRRLEDKKRKAATRGKVLTQVREILQDRPSTTREIAARFGLNDDQARQRMHQLGASRDRSGRWGPWVAPPKQFKTA